MQVTHRGHQADPHPFAPPTQGGFLHCRNACDNTHWLKMFGSRSHWQRYTEQIVLFRSIPDMSGERISNEARKEIDLKLEWSSSLHTHFFFFNNSFVSA